MADDPDDGGTEVPSDTPSAAEPADHRLDDSDRAGAGTPDRESSAPDGLEPATDGGGDRIGDAPGAEGDPAPDGGESGGGESGGAFLRDFVTTVAIVLLIGLAVYGVSGVWPPMVAVESGSMEPNLQRGDLVFVVDNERFVPDGAQEHDGGSTGVVPADRAADTGRTSFGGPGDVIVFRPGGDDRSTPIIHRAMFWVEAGENWYDRADPEAVGSANDCEELYHCPAPHAGFVTLGDANSVYDQQDPRSQPRTAPVRPEWIVGTAELRVPYLGYVRLYFAGQTARPADTGAPAGTATAPRLGAGDVSNRTPPAVAGPTAPRGALGAVGR